MNERIIQAKDKQVILIKEITIQTIQSIYPHYYPSGAVEFFITHHSEQNILQDIQLGGVYMIYDNYQNAVGTVTIKGNEINRLFVLPQFQRKGFGKQLMDFAEECISKHYQNCQLDASLPAKIIYLKRGYQIIKTDIIETKSGDYLCYDVMQKDFAKRLLGE